MTFAYPARSAAIGTNRRAAKQSPETNVVAACLLAATLAGCSGGDGVGPPLIPVSGMVKMNGKPLTTGGSVSYRDATGLVQPGGRIEEDGTYKLFLDKREGAPAGHYRVVVFASEPRAETAGHGGLPRLIIHKQFMDPNTTPLKVEVKEESPPGAYDLMVTGIK